MKPMKPVSFPPLPTTRELIKLYGLSAKQKLSQNFILDLNLCEKFAKQADPLKGCTVLEVGPGPGGITRGLLKAGAERVIAVEKDSRFLPALSLLKNQLSPHSKLEIVMGDALQVDERELLKPYVDENSIDKNNPPIRVVGNLPFGVATELLLKWVRQIARKEGIYAYGRVPMALSFQTEVADRIIAKPNNKEYSRLSVMTQLYMETELGFRIDPKSFVPPPDVQATVVRFFPRSSPLVDGVCVETLEEILRVVFGQRRKKLSNSLKLLKGVTSKEVDQLVEEAKIDVNLRPENLSVPQWCSLSILYQSLLSSKPPSQLDNNKNSNNDINNDINNDNNNNNSNDNSSL